MTRTPGGSHFIVADSTESGWADHQPLVTSTGYDSMSRRTSNRRTKPEQHGNEKPERCGLLSRGLYTSHPRCGESKGSLSALHVMVMSQLRVTRWFIAGVL